MMRPWMIVLALAIIGAVLVLDTDAVVVHDDVVSTDAKHETEDDVKRRLEKASTLHTITLEGTPHTRTNTISKKQERTYSVKLLQDRMTLFKEGTKGDQDHLNPKGFVAYQRSDMFMMARQFDLSQLPPTHIVEFKPLVTQLSGMTFDNTIVHHIDMFLCTDDLDSYPVEDFEVPGMEGHVACDSMPWAYDRDARKLVLPDHVGVAVGKGTPYTRLALEWHYLLGRDGRKDLKKFADHFTDTSGIVLTVTPDMRHHSAATFGVIDGSMKLPPGEKEYDFKMSTAGTRLTKMLAHDLGKYGELHPMATHLHMHAHGRKIWVEHEREKKKLGEFGRIDKYKGFGVDQSFFVIDEGGDRHLKAQYSLEANDAHFESPEKLGSLKAGDELATHCVFDTTCKYAVHDHAGATSLSDHNCEKATEPIVYGLSHGQEMCGILMMYYPHDPSARFGHGNVIGYQDGDIHTTKMQTMGSQFMTMAGRTTHHTSHMAMAGRATMAHGMPSMMQHHDAFHAPAEDVEVMPEENSRSGVDTQVPDDEDWMEPV